jgi:hypothetical protein
LFNPLPTLLSATQNQAKPMAEQDEFIRVGTTLYKIVDQPLIDGAV